MQYSNTEVVIDNVKIKDSTIMEIHNKAKLKNALKHTVNTINTFPPEVAKQIYHDFDTGKALCVQFLQLLSVQSNTEPPTDLLYSIYKTLMKYPGVVAYLNKHLPIFLNAQKLNGDTGTENIENSLNYIVRNLPPLSLSH